jgi:uncharacterized protein (DUF433 family)
MDRSVVSVNRNVQGGVPCFAGTRVPISTLFDHLKLGYTIDYVLEQFPSIKREQVQKLLEESKRGVEREARAASVP